MKPADCLLIILALLAISCQKDPATPPRQEIPAYGSIASFQLVDQSGQAFSQDQLSGRYWVVNFMFTRCPTICPALTRTMSQVGHRWRKEDRVQFLSVSVDASYDTVERLQDYIRSQQLRTDNWKFLTGPPEDIRTLCLESFKLALAEDMDANGDITHSSRMVLLDPQGQIRGYFEGQDAADLDRLHTTIEHLMEAEEVS